MEGSKSRCPRLAKGIIDKSGGNSFPGSARIRKKSEYDRVKMNGKRLHSRHFLFLFMAAPEQESRLGTIITKHIDKRAAVRNRVRRMLREVFRLNRARLLTPVDIVCIARNGVQSCSFAEVRDEVLAAFKRQRLLRQEAA